MAKPYDLHRSVVGGLRSLEYSDYLCVMWVVGSRLREMFMGEDSFGGVSLMASVLDVVRGLVLQGEIDSSVISMDALVEAWRLLTAQKAADASPGLLNVWITFHALSREIIGVEPRYSAVGRISNCIVEYARPLGSAGQYRRISTNEEFDEGSVTAQTFGEFSLVAQVVQGRKNISGPVDPREVCGEVFGR